MSTIDDILSDNSNIHYDGNPGNIIDDHVLTSFPGETNMIKTETAAIFETREEQKHIQPYCINQHSLPPKILSSGIYALDRSIGGGFPGGSVIYFSTTTKSMSEVFLYQFTQSRKTYYFCTERQPKYVQQDIANMNFDTSQIVFIDLFGLYFMSPHGEMIANVGNEFVDNKMIDFMEHNFKSILLEENKGEVNIIIDTFNFFMNLHLNSGIIRKMINFIYETTKEIGGLTFLYSLKNSNDKKVESEIINICDAIFNVDIEKTSDKIINKFSIPKIRGMTPTTEMIKYKISEGVQIDTSKDIV